jgi:acetyl/propionyl-CoA carboxylase alpha subunit
MIAKLVASGADRGTAIDRLRVALDGFYIGGVQHNIAFLATLAANRRFRDGALSTNFLARLVRVAGGARRSRSGHPVQRRVALPPRS